MVDALEHLDDNTIRGEFDGDLSVPFIKLKGRSKDRNLKTLKERFETATNIQLSPNNAEITFSWPTMNIFTENGAGRLDLGSGVWSWKPQDLLKAIACKICEVS